ncbi:SMI1/KNR4 family protein [Streptomyces sp. TLI_171]|uniref:SMI1/KNR4 family protein n=1 Tax=Streptomyces sp. TLI_171 TaxID=1938859 RepID=UPI000C46BFAA|nr:SMI1/KNR4 family protein [Streptomyces sp. TLI_171]RKE05121.1 SMI1/KNR4 family protein SUKH-1 [Streptomyces sp. TLI_171]
MAVTGLDRLRQRLGEPEQWGAAVPDAWSASEAFLGLVLPADYKAFLDLYGPGSIDGYVQLDRPVDGSEEEAERLWDHGWSKAGERDPELDPWPFHPEEGGLIAWGCDEQGNWYFFLAAEPDPDDWRIIVRGEAGEWFETAGTFTDFLLRCFDRVDRPPFIDPHWPGKEARYHQSPQAAARVQPAPARTAGGVAR